MILINVGAFTTKKFQLQAPKALLGLLPVRNLQQKTIVSKILADLISKVIDESEKIGESWKQTDRQKNSRKIWMAEEVQ